MKKIILLFSLFSLLMCISTTDAAAFVISKKGEAPPQYFSSKNEKIAHLIFQTEEEPDLEALSHAAQFLGFMTFLSIFTFLFGFR